MSVEVKAGSVWMYGGEQIYIYAENPDRKDEWTICSAGTVDADDGYIHKEQDCCWLSGSALRFSGTRIADDIDPRIITTPAREDGYPARCLVCGGDKAGGKIDGAFSCWACFGIDFAGHERLAQQWFLVRQPAKAEAKKELGTGAAVEAQSSGVTSGAKRNSPPSPSKTCSDCSSPAVTLSGRCAPHELTHEKTIAGLMAKADLARVDQPRFSVPPSQPAMRASWRLR